MSEIVQDIRYALRALVRQPALSVAVILTLAIGVGLNGSVFSIVNAYLFRPLEVRDPGRIVLLGQTTPDLERPHEMSFPDIEDQKALPVYADVAAFTNDMVNIGATPGQHAERAFVNETTANFFSLLGVEAIIGRTFAPDEDQGHGAHRVLVLDYRFWQQHFGADRGVVGRTIVLNGQTATIIGVLPESFHGVQAILQAHAYMPLNQGSNDLTSTMQQRGSSFLNVVARLAPGVTVAQARAASAALADRIAKENPVSHQGVHVVVVPERLARPHLFVSSITPLASAVFMALSALVLIVACANVASLLLSRAVARERELAVRAALGAGRGRIARLLLVEGLVLGGAGGIAALGIAAWSASLLSRLRLATDAPVRFEFSADWRVLAFTMVAALVAGVLAGVLPALRGSRDVQESLRAGPRAGGPARQRARSVLVVAQVAVAVVVLAAAGMFLRSVQRAGQVDLGFHPDSVLLASMAPADEGYDDARSHAFADRLLERLATQPGVRAVAIARRTPLGYNNSSDRVEPEGGLVDGTTNLVANTNVVTPGYFGVLDIPLLQGRDFNSHDDSLAPKVAVVSQAFARLVWGNASAVGRRFHQFGDSVPYTVVGVAANSVWQGLSGGPRTFIYYPLSQHSAEDITLNIRTAGDPLAAIGMLRATVRELDADLPLYDVRSFRQHLDGGITFFFLRVAAAFASLFAGLALALGAVGLFGLIAFGVAQRQREIGIRLALGAQPGAVQGRVLAGGLRLVLGGLAVGVPLSLVVARAMAGLLVRTSPADPLALGGGVVLLLAVAALAAWLPARRAAAVDPMTALRSE